GLRSSDICGARRSVATRDSGTAAGPQMSAEAIARALSLRRSGHDYVGACPSCGYKSGFSVTKKDAKVLAYCAAGGCDQTAVWSALVKLGLVPERERMPQHRKWRPT